MINYCKRSPRRTRANPPLGGAGGGGADSGPWMAGTECHRGRPRGEGARAAVVAPGLGLGLGLAAGFGRGAPTGRGGRAAGAGLVGVWALAAAGLLTVGTGLGARLGGFPRGFGGGLPDEDLVVVVDEVVAVVEVVESEAEERAVGDGGVPWAAGAGVGCWVLRVVRTRVRVRALGVCARFPW